MIIAVDHGNSQIKTPNCVFPSALIESKSRLPMATEVLEYKNSFYTLINQRVRYRRDKTTDEHFYLLTLFGIAKELEEAESYVPGMDVVLSVGLPPEHYAKQSDRFYKYFLKEEDAKPGRDVKFTYNGNKYHVRVKDVYVFPQAYAAFCSEPSLVEKKLNAYIVDIGGYTVDILRIAGGQPDLSVCRSLDRGVITMCNQIISHIDTNFELPIKEEHVLAVLNNKATVLDRKVKEEITKKAQEYVNETIAHLRELGVDLRIDTAIMVGGGTQLLKSQIEASPYFSDIVYIEDVRANAIGYSLMANVLESEKEIS
jgi:plasmid segregation protein ParM